MGYLPVCDSLTVEFVPMLLVLSLQLVTLRMAFDESYANGVQDEDDDDNDDDDYGVF